MNPGKGREMNIFLTPAGKQFIKEQIAPVFTMENEALSQMSSDETDLLLSLTEKYLDCLRNQIQKDIV